MSELILNQDTFSFLKKECETIIDTGKRLPEFVFKQHFAKYFAIEYAYIYTSEFGEFLSEMSRILGDNSVNYIVLDPDPVDWYYRRGSFFGLVTFEPSTLTTRYVSAMFREHGITKLLAGANVGAFWGSSLEWGIFCDRISWEIAVIAVPANVDVPAISGFRCMDASWLLDYEKSQYHAKDSSDSIASNFTKHFLANYPI